MLPPISLTPHLPVVVEYVYFDAKMGAKLALLPDERRNWGGQVLNLFHKFPRM
jgi:hypothetical protein